MFMADIIGIAHGVEPLTQHAKLRGNSDGYSTPSTPSTPSAMLAKLAASAARLSADAGVRSTIPDCG